MPTYQGGRFVAAAVESVLAQTFADFELVVVDDASEDETVQTVSRLADPRVRIVRNAARLGLAGNWNQAASEARGRYVKLLAQDDLLYPRCVEVQVAAMERPENAGVSLVCSKRDIINPDGVAIIRDRAFPRVQGRLSGREAIRRIVRSGTNLLGEPGAILARAEVYRTTGPFDDTSPFMIDVERWVRMLEAGDLCVLPETLSAFRVSSSSLSTRISRSQGREARRFFRDVRRRHPDVVRRRDVLLGCARATAYQWARQLIYLRAARGKDAPVTSETRSAGT
jgi:glycosyltransferase involved in cell wall biosynthesis